MSSDAAWVEIEALKQQDKQNKLQLAEFVKENAQLRAEVSASEVRAIKLNNYTSFSMPTKAKTKMGNFTRGTGDGCSPNGGCKHGPIPCGTPYQKTKR